jgi:hypothetical protein
VSASHAAEPLPGSAELRAALAGPCGTLVGIGLTRFAYALLLPALIESGWLAPAEAAHTGAANLVGYLAGSVLMVESVPTIHVWCAEVAGTVILID